MITTPEVYRETLIHGATRSQIITWLNTAPWRTNSQFKQEIINCSAGSPILPQALAVYLTMVHGQAFTEQQVVSTSQSLQRRLRLLGRTWDDSLQASLFSIATQEAGISNILNAITMEMKYETETLKREPRNYCDWICVQGFLWHNMKPPERARPVMKLMEVLLVGMRLVADEFPDDTSPFQMVRL